MHVVLVCILFIALQCYFASIFHVLTRFRAATYYVAELSDEEQGALGRCRALSYANGVDGLIYLQCFRSYLY